MYGTETGKKSVGTMNFDGGTGYTYASSLDSKRGFEDGGSSKTKEDDWFSFSGKKISFGAKNKDPGDYLRIIVDAASAPNKNPVAADYTKSVTENTYSKNPSYFNINDNSTDANGDTLTVTHIKYCLLYTSPSPRDRTRSRMPSSA